MEREKDQNEMRKLKSTSKNVRDKFDETFIVSTFTQNLVSAGLKNFGHGIEMLLVQQASFTHFISFFHFCSLCAFSMFAFSLLFVHIISTLTYS